MTTRMMSLIVSSNNGLNTFESIRGEDGGGAAGGAQPAAASPTACSPSARCIASSSPGRGHWVQGRGWLATSWKRREAEAGLACQHLPPLVPAFWWRVSFPPSQRSASPSAQLVPHYTSPPTTRNSRRSSSQSRRGNGLQGSRRMRSSRRRCLHGCRSSRRG